MRRPFSLVVFAVAASFVHAASPLSTESSAFLRSHADSPVKWLPWGEAAFARAKAEQKPIFLAIGNLTSEFSRAMARQTFANADTAAFLNESFVCILADSKEQPQLTELYQNYIQSVKQLSGLPLNIWLTPELKPFDGANYLPPTEEWGKEGFLTVAKRAAAGWKADPAAQRTKAEEAVATVIAAQATANLPALTPAEAARTLASGIETWQARYDASHGGFSEPPKRLEPELLRVLLRDPATREMALSTLHAISNGAVRDPLDGGFFRYGSDAEWRLPYFQKHLTDQARMALALLDAEKASEAGTFTDAARETLHFVLQHLRDPSGEFINALDATSDAATAAHLWTRDEITAALGDRLGNQASAAFGVTAAGNLPADAISSVTATGKNILFHNNPKAEASLGDARTKLLKTRQDRAAPLRDDAAPSAALGLLLTALTRAGDEAKDAQLADAANRLAVYLREHLLAPDGNLRHLPGRPEIGTPADYALVIEGLLTLKSVTGNKEAGELAQTLAAKLNHNHRNADSGRYRLTHEDANRGLWASVHPAAPSAGELPAAESVMLQIISTRQLAGEAGLLARALATEADESAEPPRGDLLLALHAFAHGK